MNDEQRRRGREAFKCESNYCIKLKGYMNLYRNTYENRPKYTIGDMTSGMVDVKDGLTERKFMDQVEIWEQTELGKEIKEKYGRSSTELISEKQTELMLDNILEEVRTAYLESATEDEVVIWFSTRIDVEKAIKAVYMAASKHREGAYEMMYVSYMLVADAISMNTLSERYRADK